MFKNLKIILLISAFIGASFFCGVNNLFAAANVYTIIIHPAHGGTDTGIKVTDKKNEKTITLAIVHELQKELSRESNIKVILTRDSDTDMSAEKINKIVRENKPDFFISIHINKGFGKHASGFELYYPGFGKDAVGGKKEIKDLSNEKINQINKSVRMAQLIQRNLDLIFTRKGRGLREADNPQMEGLSVPTLIVEIGFASNSDDRKKVLSEKTQKEIALALAKSIKSFYR
ncbi:MAG: N-acetylmuramoyl-L-alanine amidase [Syntrophaceae bacterium]|nr:N-acetylmuramoyl-L-alanine amidase [Syntrophaceae bacterium]